jgi:hypothetical protein
MYGFGSTTDLGKMNFYFSCKNYSSKVYNSFAKVVGFGTRVHQNWFCNFSIFLRFYMILKATAKTHKGGKILFTSRP